MLAVNTQGSPGGRIGGSGGGGSRSHSVQGRRSGEIMGITEEDEEEEEEIEEVEDFSGTRLGPGEYVEEEDEGKKPVTPPK
jgi:hypothetical protein